MMAHTVLGITSFWTGQFVAAREHVEQALALFDSGMRRDRDFRYAQDIRIVCLCYRVRTLMHLGYPKQAIEVLQEMEALSDELLHPPSTALFQVTACFLHYWRRDAQKSQESSDLLLASSTEYGFSQWMSFGTIIMNWSQVQNGAGELEIEQLRQAVSDWQGYGNELALPLFRGVLTDAYRTAGIVAKGLEVVGEALLKVERSGERQEEARLHWMKGELLLIQSDPDEQHAEACFQQAVKVARRQNAKYQELQATMSLSRLWQAQGRKEEARNLLSGIYDWFTEGFDTADLKDAKALLEELS